MVLGRELARSLGARVGDAITLIAPAGQVTRRRGAPPQADDGGGHV